jgi:hypothetical protein
MGGLHFFLGGPGRRLSSRPRVSESGGGCGAGSEASLDGCGCGRGLGIAVEGAQGYPRAMPSGLGAAIDGRLEDVINQHTGPARSINPSTTEARCCTRGQALLNRSRSAVSTAAGVSPTPPAGRRCYAPPARGACMRRRPRVSRVRRRRSRFASSERGVVPPGRTPSVLFMKEGGWSSAVGVRSG